MACTWLREFSSCSCLTALPDPAWVLLSKICKPFAGSLYIINLPTEAFVKMTKSRPVDRRLTD